MPTSHESKLSKKVDTEALSGLEAEIATYLAFAAEETPDEVPVIWKSPRPEAKVNPYQECLGKQQVSVSRLRSTVLADKRPTQNSRLLSLPNELKDMISKNVVNQHDLSQLSQTCLTLREVVVPILFGAIDLDISKHQGSQLLRTIKESVHAQRFAHAIKMLNLRITTWEAQSFARQLLDHAPRLTRLSIHYGLDQRQHRMRTIRYHPCIDCNTLSSALLSVKDTLQDLKISYEFKSDGGEFSSNTTHGSCCLQQLHCLQVVDIPFFVLLGWAPSEAPELAKILPPSLTALRIGDDDWIGDRIRWDENSMVKVFAKFVGNGAWRLATPNLASVSLSLWGYDYSFDDCPEREWRTDVRFKQFCKENGLRCDVIRNFWNT